MESARLLIAGLETVSIPEEERDKRFVQFCELVDFFHETKVILSKESGLDTHTFSFGMMSDFLYGSWENIKNNVSLKGITQKTYQMMAPSLMQKPKLGKEITESDWDQKQHPKTSYGLLQLTTATSYVTDIRSWQNTRAEYYANNQSYVWKEDDNEFLPNRLLSDKILFDEIEKHGFVKEFSASLKIDPQNALAIVFHDKVMKNKGGSLLTYTQEIGSKICEANYYKYEEELTKKERQRAKSKRRIYSIINRDGKKQYISLDFKHGMMEFHDEHGTHLGEFRFTGLKNAEAETSHDLKSL